MSSRLGTSDSEGRPPTLGAAMAAIAARRRQALALRVDAADYSYGDLDARARAVAAALSRRGVRAGDRIAVGLPNSLELVTAVVGVLRAGAVLVPLNPAASTEEADYVLRDAQVRGAIVTEEHAAGLGAGLLDLSSVIPDGATVPAPAPPPAAAAIDAESPALIVYTSGTTGRPKGAVLSHRALLSNLMTVAEAWQWTERDRLLLTVPCFHLHGLGLGLLGSFLVGSSVVLRRRFVAADLGADLAGTQATMFFGVPTMYNRLVALPEGALRPAALRQVRLWVSGSAPLTASTFERFRERCGQEILDRYGMTECGFVLAAPYDRPRRPGVVGLPLPGISVRLVDQEAAHAGRLVEVADGTQGELVIRGPNLFSGYWNRPEDTRRAFVDGYLCTGDLAVREPDGMVRLVGRSSLDIIKTRGFKVSAVEIENCLHRHAQVEEVAVVGVADADQGERIVAAIILAPGAAPSAEAIRQFARQHLAPHKVPTEVVFLPDLPRTGPGKLKKAELIRLLTA